MCFFAPPFASLISSSFIPFPLYGGRIGGRGETNGGRKGQRREGGRETNGVVGLLALLGDDEHWRKEREERRG